MNYSEAVERGYDGPPPSRNRATRCGGWAGYNGPCGATDCDSCYPGGSGQEPARPWLSDSGYYLGGDNEWEKVISRKTRTARHDHADGTVKAGERYRVTAIRWIDDETGKSRVGHQKTILERVT